MPSLEDHLLSKSRLSQPIPRPGNDFTGKEVDGIAKKPLYVNLRKAMRTRLEKFAQMEDDFKQIMNIEGLDMISE